jgi:hypothetical protein
MAKTAIETSKLVRASVCRRLCEQRPIIHAARDSSVIRSRRESRTACGVWRVACGVWRVACEVRRDLVRSTS